MRTRRQLAALAAALACGLGQAGGAPAAQPPERAPLVTVEDPWVRGTVEGQTGSGAYMRLTSREDAQLVGASSPVAERVEIHEMHTVKDMMTMRRIERLALPAHTPVALDHDYHVMFIGLKHQLVVGESVPMTLHLLDARGRPESVQLRAPVRPLATPVHPAVLPGTAPAAGHGATGTPHG